MNYQFTLSELRPVIKVEVSTTGGIYFWFTGENLSDPPMQKVDEEGSWGPWYPELRPLLEDSKTIRILHDQGEEACIRHINMRIADFILDQYDKVRDSCPESLEKKYLGKIDEFYIWFWDRRQPGDAKIFGRFLQHIQSIRQKRNPPATWYTLREAAVYTRTGVTKLRELIDAGKLKSHRLDDAKSKSTILIHRKDMDSIILFDRSVGLTKRQQERLKAYQG